MRRRSSSWNVSASCEDEILAAQDRAEWARPEPELFPGEFRLFCCARWTNPRLAWASFSAERGETPCGAAPALPLSPLRVCSAVIHRSALESFSAHHGKPYRIVIQPIVPSSSAEKLSGATARIVVGSSGQELAGGNNRLLPTSRLPKKQGRL